jgi:zinc protease
VTYDRDLDFLDQLPSLLNEPTLENVKTKTQKYIKPNQWVWLIVGDLKKIEEPIRNLNLAPIEVIEL